MMLALFGLYTRSAFGIHGDGHDPFIGHPADDFDTTRCLGSLIAHALADGIQKLFLCSCVDVAAKEIGQCAQNRCGGIHAKDGDRGTVLAASHHLLTHHFRGQATRHENEAAQAGDCGCMDLR